MTTTNSESGYRILVIDDNPMIHATFRSVLGGGKSAMIHGTTEIQSGRMSCKSGCLNFEIDAAPRGEEGYELACRAVEMGRPYALAFVDARMPGWDGIETVLKLWEVAPDMQVVICTAYSDYSWDQMITRTGHSDRLLLLKKPFDAAEVMQLAHSLTEKWRLLQLTKSKVDDLEKMVGARTIELKSANEKLRSEVARREQIETELLQAQKMEAVGRLAGGIAHDFNNILTAIMGYSELILEDAASDNVLRSNAEEIFKSAQRAAELTRRLLAFSRRQILELKITNLSSLVNDLLKTLSHLISENVELITVNTADLWPVNVDPNQMEQVIINMSINAHDAMPKGGKLTIETANIVLQDTDRAVTHEGISPGKYVVLAVSDTGVGMTPEVQGRLFEPFFTTKEFGKGTGLGLATCYGIIKQSGGHIAVSSEPGRGSTFRIYLPRADVMDTTVGKQRQSHCQPGGTETILLVEDEPSLRLLATKILCNLGYTVLPAENGV